MQNLEDVHDPEEVRRFFTQFQDGDSAMGFIIPGGVATADERNPEVKAMIIDMRKQDIAKFVTFLMRKYEISPLSILRGMGGEVHVIDIDLGKSKEHTLVNAPAPDENPE